ncbi:MAG TPA: helix-hairpin-helix domain-containing protein [Gemmatimonadales bacterium]
MQKPAIRQALEELASYLELSGENPFKVRAFENAARAIGNYAGDVADAAASGALADVKGIGKGTLEVVRELISTGRSADLESLRGTVPRGLVEMLRVPGLGVAKIRQLHETLQIDSLDALEAAAADGRLAKLPRFGAKTAEAIRNAVAFLKRSSGFRLFHHARDEASALQQAIAAVPGVARVEIAGSIRRRCEVIRETALVVVCAAGVAPDELRRRIAAVPGAAAADVAVTTVAEFGWTWIRATGSASHLEQLERRGAARGVALAGAAGEEADAYAALGLSWIPPEVREGDGEIAAAEKGPWPRLAERSDLRGFLHCHSTWSDGTVTIPEWAAACREAGYHWMGLTDHSQAAAYAGGLKPADVARQHQEIDRVNAANPDFRILKGIEADILADGALDYGAEVLGRFDFVIGSVHSRFGLTKDEMTARVLAAMDDPHLTILGHPTGRLLLAREAFAIDLDRVLARAAETGVAVEINGDPHRLDLDWRLVRRAHEMGIAISIGSDAHAVAGLANVDVGLGIARKGWLQGKDLLNALDAGGFLARARKRRGG